MRGDALPRMTITCLECERDVAYRNIKTQTTLESQGFVTTYHCPHCEGQLTNVPTE